MPTTVACCRCGISTVVELEQIPITIEYDHAEWERKCASPDAGGIALCANMRVLLEGLNIALGEPAMIVERRRVTGDQKDGGRRD